MLRGIRTLCIYLGTRAETLAAFFFLNSQANLQLHNARPLRTLFAYFLSPVPIYFQFLKQPEQRVM